MEKLNFILNRWASTDNWGAWESGHSHHFPIMSNNVGAAVAQLVERSSLMRGVPNSVPGRAMCRAETGSLLVKPETR